jgi:hypothetical protein
MKTFADLTFTSYLDGQGTQARLQFTNGYGIYVFKTPWTIGGTSGNYCGAVLSSNGLLDPSTSVPDQYDLTETEVTQMMASVQEL